MRFGHLPFISVKKQQVNTVDVKGCLHEGGGPQVGDPHLGGVTRLSM